MRKGAKARFIAGLLEGKDLEGFTGGDGELRDLARIADLLSAVSSAEPQPSPEAGSRMRKRVEEYHRRMREEELRRRLGRDPTRRVSVLEPRRVSYAVATAAASLVAVLLVSLALYGGLRPGAPVVTPPGMAGFGEGEAGEIWLYASGKVEVRPPGGEWVAAAPPLYLEEGSAVRTPDDVRAAVYFPGDSLARLDYGSEATLTTGKEGKVALDLAAGQIYCRAQEGTSFALTGGGLQVETAGTVCNLMLGEKTVEALAILHEIRAGAAGDGERARIPQGRVVEVPLTFGEGKAGGEGLEPYIDDITTERLRDEWLLWNRFLDEARGWDTGILSGVELEEGPAGMEEEEERIEEEGEEAGESQVAKPEITLHASLQRTGVSLTWEVARGEVEEFVLLRAVGALPVYPRDVLARLPGTSKSYLDSGVEQGKSYTYRLAAEQEGTVFLSNAVTVRLPAPSPTISLAAKVVDGGGGRPAVELAWHVEGALAPDYFVLVRAQGEEEPVYPPGSQMPSWRFSPSGMDYTYIDREIYTGYTYRYRVYAVKDGRAVLSSNTATVYVQTSSLY